MQIPNLSHYPFGDDNGSQERNLKRSTNAFVLDHLETKRIDFEGTTYECSKSVSPNEQWLVAFGPGDRGDKCQVFGVRKGTIEYNISAERPTECWIANNGVTVVVDAGSPYDMESKVLFVTCDNGTADTRTVSTSANVGSATISPDGQFGAFVSIGAKKKVHLFDINSGEERAQYIPEHGSRHLISFDDSCDECYLYDAGRDMLVCAIDTNGNRTWSHSRFEKSVPIFTRMMERIK